MKELLKTHKTTLLILGCFLLAWSAVKLQSNQPTPDKEIDKPSVELTTGEAPSFKKSLKVERLEIEPEQIVLLNTVVNETSVEITIAAIEKLAENYKNIYLVLDSPGGSVFDGARLISYMEGSKANINTICYSLCASMAAQIHQHGKIRYMIDRSTLMFHQASGGVSGQVEEMMSQLNFVKLEVDRLDAYVSDRAGMSREKFKEMIQNELWISAEDSINKKLADKLVVLNLDNDNEEQFNVGEELKKRKIKVTPGVHFKNPLKEFK